jgi:hypothetical protein
MTPDTSSNAEILATTCILPVALIVRGSIDIHHLEFYSRVSRMTTPPLALAPTALNRFGGDVKLKGYTGLHLSSGHW